MAAVWTLRMRRRGRRRRVRDAADVLDRILEGTFDPCGRDTDGGTVEDAAALAVLAVRLRGALASTVDTEAATRHRDAITDAACVLGGPPRPRAEQPVQRRLPAV